MKNLHQKLLKRIDSDIEKTISAVRKKYHALEMDRLEGKAKQDNTYVRKPELQRFKTR